MPLMDIGLLRQEPVVWRRSAFIGWLRSHRRSSSRLLLLQQNRGAWNQCTAAATAMPSTEEPVEGVDVTPVGVVDGFVSVAGFAGVVGVVGSTASFSNTAWMETLPSGISKALFSMETLPFSTFHSLKW